MKFLFSSSKIKKFIIKKPRRKALLTQIIIGAICIGVLLIGSFVYEKIFDLRFEKQLLNIELANQAKINQAKITTLQHQMKDTRQKQNQQINSLQSNLKNTAIALENTKIDIDKQVEDNKKSSEQVKALEGKVKELESQPKQIVNQTTITSDTNWSNITNSITPYVVKLYTGDGYGSGIIYSPKGFILTNAHIVNYDYNTIVAVGVSNSVYSSPTYKYFARVFNINSEMDLASLVIYEAVVGYNLPTQFDYYDAVNKIATAPKIGDKIGVLGYPGTGGYTITFTSGEVSGFSENTYGYPVIKTSAKIMPGNSGGIAFDKNGNFIGVPTYAKISSIDSLGYILNFTK